jgi:hypothetical protein
VAGVSRSHAGVDPWAESKGFSTLAGWRSKPRCDAPPGRRADRRRAALRFKGREAVGYQRETTGRGMATRWLGVVAELPGKRGTPRLSVMERPVPGVRLSAHRNTGLGLAVRPPCFPTRRFDKVSGTEELLRHSGLRRGFGQRGLANGRRVASQCCGMKPTACSQMDPAGG